eukprot:TRINITY_DN3644_c0_g1_i1.p1 TRINITY_DN3644_c0_g1~~TRINITY_DN3644_c0_g1_i1.p1  ORF type:complete len:246 (-),score=28.79 TRINITY_DN3644_c0_g1_i1:41-778(-)
MQATVLRVFRGESVEKIRERIAKTHNVPVENVRLLMKDKQGQFVLDDGGDSSWIPSWRTVRTVGGAALLVGFCVGAAASGAGPVVAALAAKYLEITITSGMINIAAVSLGIIGAIAGGAVAYNRQQLEILMENQGRTIDIQAERIATLFQANEDLMSVQQQQLQRLREQQQLIDSLLAGRDAELAALRATSRPDSAAQSKIETDGVKDSEKQPQGEVVSQAGCEARLTQSPSLVPTCKPDSHDLP